MNKTEARLQQECYMHFNNTYPRLRSLYFKIKNEGTNKITGALDKATGIIPGVADSLLLLPFESPIFIEFKTKEGRQSESQKKWEGIITAHGYKYYIIRTLEEFIELCKIYLSQYRTQK